MLRASLVLLCLVAAHGAYAADPVYPPGSRIGLVPPPNMKVSRGVAGFQDAATGAAIISIEMPVDAYPSIAAAFTDDALKKQGFTLRSRDSVKVGGTDAILVSGDQDEGGKSVPKSVLLAGDPTITALVIGQLPVGASPPSEEEMRAALKTVTLRPPLSMDEQLAALPFAVGELSGFRPVRVMAGNSLLLTDGPNEMTRNADQPILIVAQSFAPAPPPDQRDVFAKSALVSNTFLRDPVLERAQSFRQGGSEWHELVAKAKDGPSEQPVVVLQTIRFERDGYLRMVGIVREQDRDAVMPRFRRIVDSISIK